MEEKKSYLKKFWDEEKELIICVGLVALVYRMGYCRGYNSAVGAVNSAFKALGEAIDVTKF